jgi:hypothetical protein
MRSTSATDMQALSDEQHDHRGLVLERRVLRPPLPMAMASASAAARQ